MYADVGLWGCAAYPLRLVLLQLLPMDEAIRRAGERNAASTAHNPGGTPAVKLSVHAAGTPVRGRGGCGARGRARDSPQRAVPIVGRHRDVPGSPRPVVGPQEDQQHRVMGTRGVGSGCFMAVASWFSGAVGDRPLGLAPSPSLPAGGPGAQMVLERRRGGRRPYREGGDLSSKYEKADPVR